uniref:Uncharacterized protein n=1 Tax=Rhizophora mucronata TaxID=61149 RepID=A0A2P2QWU6_RHIMU
MKSKEKIGKKIYWNCETCVLKLSHMPAVMVSDVVNVFVSVMLEQNIFSSPVTAHL